MIKKTHLFIQNITGPVISDEELNLAKRKGRL